MEAADMINILCFIDPLMEGESSFGVYTNIFKLDFVTINQ